MSDIRRLILPSPKSMPCVTPGRERLPLGRNPKLAIYPSRNMIPKRCCTAFGAPETDGSSRRNSCGRNILSGMLGLEPLTPEICTFRRWRLSGYLDAHLSMAGHSPCTSITPSYSNSDCIKSRDLREGSTYLSSHPSRSFRTYLECNLSDRTFCNVTTPSQFVCAYPTELYLSTLKGRL